MIHARVWVWFKDKKGCPTLFPWHKCKNDDLEILCKTGYACTYADTQMSNFYGHVMLGLRIHFLYFKSTQCFQNMFFYQFVHSSESILAVRGNFHSIHPSGVDTFFLQKSVMIDEFFFKEKLEVISFSKACWFLARQLIFSFSTFFPYLLSSSPFCSFSTSFISSSSFLFLFYHDFFVYFTHIFFWTMFLNEELYTVPEFQTSSTLTQ